MFLPIWCYHLVLKILLTTVTQNTNSKIKNQKQYVLIILFLTFYTVLITAQDIHFSQLNTTPLFLNSASAGAMGQDYRASIHYKNQWNSIDGAYKTMGLSVDGKILKRGRDKKNSLSAGLTVFSDKAGASKINSLEVHGHFAYNLFVTRSQQFSAGFNAGFIQQSISVLNLNENR